MVVSFFTNLYKVDNATMSSFRMLGGFPVVDHVDYAFLAKPFIYDRVK